MRVHLVNGRGFLLPCAALCVTANTWSFHVGSDDHAEHFLIFLSRPYHFMAEFLGGLATSATSPKVSKMIFKDTIY